MDKELLERTKNKKFPSTTDWLDYINADDETKEQFRIRYESAKLQAAIYEENYTHNNGTRYKRFKADTITGCVYEVKKIEVMKIGKRVVYDYEEVPDGKVFMFQDKWIELWQLYQNESL